MKSQLNKNTKVGLDDFALMNVDGNGGMKIKIFDNYNTYKVTAPDNRIWKIISDASIQTMKNSKGKLISADKSYSVELVTPILRYDEDIETLQELIRQLRAAGAVSESRLQCGIHVHIGAKDHTPNTLKNLVNLMA